jgi:hypothetical protein
MTTTIGIRGCPKWANCTMEEKLWADYPHAVWIRQGIFNNVAIITVPNVKWIRWDGCQTILRHKKSVIYYVYTWYIHGIYLVFEDKKVQAKAMGHAMYLDIVSSKSVFLRIKRVATSPHNSTVEVRFEFQHLTSVDI